MSIGQIVKVSFHTHMEEQVGIVTMDYMQSTANPTFTLNAAVVGALLANITATLPAILRACLAQEAEYDGAIARFWSASAELDVEARSSAGGGIGTWEASGYAPRQLAGLIRKVTAQTTRRGKGRMYVPFVPYTALENDGTPADTYLEVLQNLAAELIDPKEITVNAQPCVFVPAVSGRGRPGAGFEVTAMPEATEFATQRRRGSFGRPNVAVFS